MRDMVSNPYCSTVLIVIGFFSMVSCNHRKPVMLIEPNERSYTLDQLDAIEATGRPIHVTHWYTAQELDWIARDYAKQKSIDYDFSGIEALIWIPRKASHLATVEYHKGIGKQTLMVVIGLEGEVTEHSILWAIDGPVISNDLDQQQEQ